MTKTKLIVLLLGGSLATALAQTNALKLPQIADGPFKPDWNSLTNYQNAPGVVSRREVRHLGALGAAMPAGAWRLVCARHV
jgi:hypothetical protein